MFVKAGWGLAGGVLLLLTIFGQRVFPVGGSSAAGIGVLYGARGIGAGLGPIALRWILGQEPRRAAPDDRAGVLHGRHLLRRARRRADAVGSPRCASCSRISAASILWVFSTVLLQIEVPDRFRGRVFAAELALVTLLSSVSSYWTGYELDRAGWSPRRLAFALGVMFCVPGRAVADHPVAMEGAATLDPTTSGAADVDAEELQTGRASSVRRVQR